LRGLEILRKYPHKGIEPIIEVLYSFPWFSFVVIELIIKGLTIFVFLEYFGKMFSKKIPTCDRPWEDTIIPLLSPSDKSVGEKSHPNIFVLVIGFKGMEEGI
jgi:hypothetical protein